MRWNLAMSGTTADSFDTDAAAAQPTMLGDDGRPVDIDPDPEVAPQIAAAVAAGKAVIASGALGAGTFAVSATGHANLGNTPADGDMQDMVTLAVSRV